jgi:hypothetical protein
MKKQIKQILNMTQKYFPFFLKIFSSIINRKIVTASENDEINAMENVLEPMMQNLNVSREELQQKFGHDLSQMIQLEMNFYGSETYIPLNNKSRLSYLGSSKLPDFGSSKFCFTIPLDTVSFSNELDHIEISLNMSAHSSLRNVVIGSNLNFVLDFTAHLTESDLLENIVSKGIAYGSTDASLIESQISDMTNLTLGISGHYISISQTKGGSQCTTDFSKEVCQAKCRIKQIEKLCNCSPTTWPMLLENAGINNCNLTQYKHCLRLNTTGT